MDSLKEEIASTAARMVVEEGLEFGAAKRRAVRQMGLPPRTALPDNESLELAVEDYIAVFCADTQPVELQALRAIALPWMERLQDFHPHLCGAVWHGTATRHSDIYLQLFCDDQKMAEITLINQGIQFAPRRVNGFQGREVDALGIHVRSDSLQQNIGLHLLMHDLDDLRGALVPDSRGRKPRGDIAAVRRLVHDQAL